MPTIDTTHPIIVPSTDITAAGTGPLALESYTSTEDKKATVDAIIAESVKKTNKVKAATAAPKGLMAGKPEKKHGNKGQVPWNKGLKLAKGGKRPSAPTRRKCPAQAVVEQMPIPALPKFSTQAAAENAWRGIGTDFSQFTQPPAEVRQFKSKFKKGTNYDKGYEAGYQEAIHDMTMILVAQVGRKQL